MKRGRQERRDDLERLRVFRDRALRIGESTLVKERIGSSLNVRWQRGSPIVWSTREPSDDVLESLLLRLRPMVAPSSDISIFAIHNVCEARLSHAEMRRFLRDVRAGWTRSQREGIMGLRIDERDMSPERAADLMINGYYFHDEPAKRAELEKLVGPAAILTRHVFIDYVYRAVDAVYSTADVVRIGLERDLFDAR